MDEMIRVPGPEWETSSLEQWRFAIDILLHVLLLSLAISPFLVLYLKRKSPAGWRDFVMLMIAFLIAPIGHQLVVAALPKYFKPFVTGYLLLCLLVLFISMLIIARRLKEKSQGSFAISVLATLLALGAMIGLTLPAVPSAREAANRMKCSHNIRALGLALLKSHTLGTDFSLYPPNNRPLKEGDPPISWRVQLLPQLGYGTLRSRYVDAATWDSSENLPWSKTKVAAYTCPSEPNLVSPAGGRFTSYAMLDNSDRDPNNPKIPVASLTEDQVGYRILLIESCGANIVWSEPRDVDLDTMEWSFQSSGRDGIHAPWKSNGVGSSWHGSGMHVVFADGSTRFVPSSIDKRIIERMLRGDPWNESDFE